MKQALALGNVLWTEYAVPIKVEPPIINLSKAEIIKLGLNLGHPLGAHLELL